MKDIVLLSKLVRRHEELKDKSLTAYLLKLTSLIAHNEYAQAVTLLAEVTQSDAVFLKIGPGFHSQPLSQEDEGFLKGNSTPKAGQHFRLHSLLTSSLIHLARCETHAFSDNDKSLLDRISEHLSEDLIRLEEYQEVVRDTRTGFFSREFFFDFFENEFTRSKRYQAPLSLILIDIDGFSRFSNPDLVLEKTAQRIKTEVRQGDFIARISENTFALIEPMTLLKNAAESTSRLLSKFRHLPILIQETPIQIQLSIGIASLIQEDEFSASILERSDKALQAAKHLGGNHIVIHD